MSRHRKAHQGILKEKISDLDSRFVVVGLYDDDGRDLDDALYGRRPRGGAVILINAYRTPPTRWEIDTGKTRHGRRALICRPEVPARARH